MKIQEHFKPKFYSWFHANHSERGTNIDASIRLINNMPDEIVFHYLIKYSEWSGKELQIDVE